MTKYHKVNNIFDESGITFNELINNFLLSFLDREFSIYDSE